LSSACDGGVTHCGMELDASEFLAGVCGGSRGGA
jgi:hypothetical protein